LKFLPAVLLVFLLFLFLLPGLVAEDPVFSPVADVPGSLAGLAHPRDRLE
jgi:hypothetical protein